MNRPDIQTWALDLADKIRERSRDPSNTVGAVILRPDNTLAATGYNGFPKGVNDDPKLYADRNIKLLRTIHAELNAILTAKEPLTGYTIYVSPFSPCSNCAAAIIQSGITKVVARKNLNNIDRWKDNHEQSISLFKEANVNLIITE